MQKFTLITFSLLALAACNDQSDSMDYTSSSSSSSATSDSVSSGSSSSEWSYYTADLAVLDKAELAVRRAQWEVSGYKTYQFKYVLNSDRFPPLNAPPVIVRVEDQKILDVYDIDSGEYLPVEEYVDYNIYEILTIDERFDQIAAMIDRVEGMIDARRAMLTISYNLEYGYPEYIDINTAVGGQDGRSSYSISELE